MNVSVLPEPIPAVASVVRQPGSQVAFQDAVGTITYERSDGGTRTFSVMPYLPTPTSWAKEYASVRDAIGAANRHSYYWDGYVTFGVVQGKEGAYLIRPMESERGRPFVLDRDLLSEVGAVGVSGTATTPSLQAIVGRGVHLNFTDPKKVKDIRPTPLPSR